MDKGLEVIEMEDFHCSSYWPSWPWMRRWRLHDVKPTCAATVLGNLWTVFLFPDMLSPRISESYLNLAIASLNLKGSPYRNVDYAFDYTKKETLDEIKCNSTPWVTEPSENTHVIYGTGNANELEDMLLSGWRVK